METLRLSWDVGRGAIVRQPEGTKKMTCAQCGLPLPPDVGFCRACGAFVRPRSMTAPPVSTPAVIQPHDLSSSPPTAAPTPPPWAAVPGAAWAAASARGAAPLPGTRTPPSLLGDVLAAAGAGLVLISMFLTWYSVTLTALGVQFYESLERAFLSRLFPEIASGFAGLTGPITFSVPALGSGAGGWRWAILVVSIILLVEVLLAIASSARSQSAPNWPHTSILLLLSVSNLVLVAAAFFSLPYSSAPSSYLGVSPGLGAYFGLLAALLACAGVVIKLAGSAPGTRR